MSIPVLSLSSSPAMWTASRFRPTRTRTARAAPFAPATISCDVFAGVAGWAAMSCGIAAARIDTGTKSRSTSKFSLYSSGLIVCDESVKRYGVAVRRALGRHLGADAAAGAAAVLDEDRLAEAASPVSVCTMRATRRCRHRADTGRSCGSACSDSPTCASALGAATSDERRPRRRAAMTVYSTVAAHAYRSCTSRDAAWASQARRAGTDRRAPA